MKFNQFVPGIEALESRDLLAALPISLPRMSDHHAAQKSLPQPLYEKPVRTLMKRAAVLFAGDDYTRFTDAIGTAANRTANDGLRPAFRQTCNSLVQLLNKKKGAVSGDDREQLAFEVLYFIGHPDRIDQGMYPTCTATAYAGAAFFDRPELVSRLVTEAAKFARFSSPVDGRQIPVTSTGLVSPYRDNSLHDPLLVPVDGERAFCVQLLNTVFLNDVGRSPFKYVTVNNTAVSQPEPLLYVTSPGGAPSDYWTTYRGQYVTSFQGAYPSDFTLVGQAWSGNGNTLYHSAYHWPVNGAAVFGSQTELAQHLGDVIVQQHRVVVLVVSGGEIVEHFRNTPPLEEQQNHVITVTMYDPSTGAAYLNNSWGSQYDRWVSLDTLYDIAVYQPA